MPATAVVRKTFRGVEIKDAEKGTFRAVFATLNVKDFDDDVTLPGAFEEGAPVAISAYGHASWMGEMPVGRGTISVDGDKAIVDGQFFMNTTAGRETFEVVKGMGDLQEYSYGFDVLETGEVTQEMRQQGIRRALKKLKVYEVSPVLLGAGIGTETLDIKGRKAQEEADAAKQEADRQAVEMKTQAQRELARFLKTQASLAGNLP